MEKTNNLIYSYFHVDNSFRMSEDDFTNLINYYLPIIGPNAFTLYHSLNEISKDPSMKNNHYDFNTLTLSLNMSHEVLQQSRRILEAVGLMNTYSHNKKLRTVFSLQKPLDANGFKQNFLVSDLLKEKIGKTNFEAIIKRGLRKINVLSGQEIEDISTDFFDIFSEEEKNKVEQQRKEFFIQLGQIQRTPQEIAQAAKTDTTPMPLEVGNVIYSNEYQAILELSTIEFYRQIINQDPNHSAQMYIDEWQAQFKDDKTINLILFFAANKIKSKKTVRWLNFGNSLITELLAKNIHEFTQVENYLDGKFQATEEYRNLYDKKSFMKEIYLKKFRYKN
ncbi:hypothetical protein [Mycoplasmopsis gallopavonis]|uniref:DnaD domain-containing protein n=1 Tax=Mycoplasmopsis gallopavonis TaxID=76629 RepID=A0A449AZ14_9BACT|nr:hypothetical protein [Mycoplasmopsis gallopavonis]VEU72789.1 DnaD domain-containing protein [Mycoplasmopsis gallopavonis]